MIRCKLIERAAVDSADSSARVDRAVTGEVLGMGRAAAARIYLPDPRVRLEHASIHRAEDGFLYIDAAGPVFVNQRAETRVRLAAGQIITLGPYDFEVLLLEDGLGVAVAQLTMAFSQRAAAAVPQGTSARSVGLRDGWLTRRRLAWLAMLVMLLASAIPVWHVYHPPVLGAGAAAPTDLKGRAVAWMGANLGRLDNFWNPGPISSAHQTFAQDCRSCHDRPFQRVADASCTSCHKSTGAHVADKTIEHSAFAGQRCATCHKEHQGSAAMKTADVIGCEQCHSDIRRHAPKSALGNVSDFARDHPEFRLSIRQQLEPPLVQRVVRTAALRNDTGLKFPHDIHLAKVGIKSPSGPAATGGRVVMQCASCHKPDAAGSGFEPVRMAQDCQSCHRLSVDPQAPMREVPHASPAAVGTAVREIYAGLVVDRYPVSLVTVNDFLQRPTAEVEAGRSTNAARWVHEQSDRAMVAMFDKSTGVCKTCHATSRLSDSASKTVRWLVQPVVSTRHWFVQSRFSHAQHKNAPCGSCHQADKSRSASDILLPDLKTCQNCHSGARPQPDKVVSRCDSCHGFHIKTEHPSFGKTASVLGRPP